MNWTIGEEGLEVDQIPLARMEEFEMDWMSWFSGALAGFGFGGMFVLILWLLDG